MFTEVYKLLETENLKEAPPIDEVNDRIRKGDIVMFAMYACLTLATLYNTVRFLFKERRYKNFHIAYFYLLVYCIIALRTLWLSLILAVVNDNSDPATSQYQLSGHSEWLIKYSDVAATYLELLMGFQQACSMFELR